MARENLLEARLRAGGKHDERDTQPELEKREIRRRMRVALEAADALDAAIREGVVGVRFSAIENTDPLDMGIELFVDESYLSPIFTFNLRDAFREHLTEVSDWSTVEPYRPVADALEALAAEIRAELATPEEIAEFRREEAEQERERERERGKE
jgi:hypothetical protein